ncbi:YcnI family protein [Aeromicrobium wangtongii]|uniref:YcnI family protein n=1 Tax=Aeromicrobium wangtongii TaxID=2969247 RepID=UPI00201702B2|nr:YcnI family protein [Aeromicrobium wangtongii]MCL3819164.1 YcnI family protein [Aeromicrobium wangtongii]
MTRTLARLGAALTTAALVAVAAPASAHVGVSSTDAAQGGFGKVVFRVPNESDAATTTKLVVTLPADTPFAFVSTGAKPGWTVKTTTKTFDKPVKTGDFELTEAVSTITWTAEGEGTPVGQFDEFAISAGPFPDASSVGFSAQQTYSDGEVVDWDQEQAGDTEPEHPQPVLTLAAAAGDGGHGTTAHSAGGSDASADEGTELGTWLGGAALVVAAAALVVALRQNRRRA